MHTVHPGRKYGVLITECTQACGNLSNPGNFGSVSMYCDDALQCITMRIFLKGKGNQPACLSLRSITAPASVTTSDRRQNLSELEFRVKEVEPLGMRRREVFYYEEFTAYYHQKRSFAQC